MHGFIRHTARQTPVANYRNNFIFFLALVACDSQAQRGGNSRGSVSRTESVVFAFCAFGESAQTVLRADSGKFLLAAREQLVRIGLVAGVKHNFIFGRVEYIV